MKIEEIVAAGIVVVEIEMVGIVVVAGDLVVGFQKM